MDEAIVAASLELLGESGFAAMTVEGVAKRAGVGKPAIYRRFPGKAALVTAAIRTRLDDLEAPDLGDAKAELRHAMETGFPPDAGAYLRLIGGLAAEEGRHPELIEAFREHILGPRRAAVAGLIERGQERDEIRGDVDPVAAVDLLAGPLLARAFAGEDTGDEWRARMFEIWWQMFEKRSEG